MPEEEFTTEGSTADRNGIPWAAEEPPADDLEWPIGFIVVLVLAALYLGWRLIQLLAGVADFLG